MSEIVVDRGLLNQVDHNVRIAVQTINVVQGQMICLQGDLVKAQERIVQLQAYVEKMRREQKNEAALQRAITEIIRVRQELEQKFGKYQEVRDSMLGILQANDRLLVGKDAIVRVAEELMISTPQYWLSPCVIAISAWIDGQEELAKKAVEEALERDVEKTAMLMALICRRAAAVSDRNEKNNHANKNKLDEVRKNRLSASQKWLKFYFECQDPNNISRSVLLFANAYANGVFGDDTDMIIDNIIENKWLKPLAAQNPGFEEAQIETWNNLFANTMAANGKPAAEKYPNLAKFADKQDFENISAYADRVDISENYIEGYFIDINKREVDKRHLVETIDRFLMSLVKDFDEAERDLREEEKRYAIIKDYNGDVDRANARIAKEEKRKAHLAEPVSLIEYLNDTISGNVEKDDSDKEKGDENRVEVMFSEKKTALKFTKSYIQKSYNSFMDEKKDIFPEEVRATVENVTHKVKTEADAAAFERNVKTKLEAEREKKMSGVKPIKTIIFTIFCVVLSIIFFVSKVAVLGVLGIVGAILIFVFGLVGLKNKKLDISKEYDNRIKTASANVNAVVKEWCQVSNRVSEFNSKPRFDVGSVK